MNQASPDKAPPPPDPYLTPKQVAPLLGYEVKSLYKLIAAGDIPSKRMGRRGRIFIPRQGLAALFPDIDWRAV